MIKNYFKSLLVLLTLIAFTPCQIDDSFADPDNAEFTLVKEDVSKYTAVVQAGDGGTVVISEGVNYIFNY